MAEEANLPEELIVNIISRLPVKSLLKFTSVCKRWRSIISFDPQFANLLRRNKTLSRRLLACTQPSHYGIRALPKLESLDLETLSSSAGDDSLRRKLSFPFQPCVYFDKGEVSLLGSCNGLVILAQNNVFYVFNPLTRFVKELPCQGYPAHVTLTAYGFGYISATNEYKVFVSYYKRDEYEEEDWEDEDDNEEEEEEDLRVCEMISLSDQIWKRIEGPGDSFFDYPNDTPTGILLNEVLHWLKTSNEHDIVTFDLGKEEFSKIWLPDFGQDGKAFSHLGVCFGGCLCVLRYWALESDSIDFWVMREYQVSESWAKHITLRLTNTLGFANPQRRWGLKPILVMDNCTVALLAMNPPLVVIHSGMRIKFSHKLEEGEAKPSLDIFHANWYKIIEYEESLVSISQI